MILSNRKYADPTNVLKSLVDDYGNQILVGEQKDIAEFNLNLLERIEEGIGERGSNEEIKVQESLKEEQMKRQMNRMSSMSSNDDVDINLEEMMQQKMMNM